jgi:DNA-binding PadR family transcriptional regulator
MNFKGNLPLMILYILSKGANHGYSIARYIEAESAGYFDIKAGTLYPTLHNLEEQGMIESYRQIENGRDLRYYRITEKGQEKLSAVLKDWENHVRAVNRVLKGRAL